MQTLQLPLGVGALLFGSAILLIVLGVPLMQRKVPPNWAYGVRIKATMSDDAIWYAVNEKSGRDLVVLGVAYLAALILAHTLFRTASIPVRVLGPVALLSVGLIVLVVRGNSTANAMLAQSPAPSAEQR